MYRINGSIYWKHDEYVTLDLFEDYSISDAAIECNLKTSLISTLKNIPTLSAYIYHYQNTSKMDTIVKLMVYKFKEFNFLFLVVNNKSNIYLQKISFVSIRKS